MSGPNGELQAPEDGGRDSDSDDDGFGEEEYASINSMLDQINSCLDHLEEKNDYLHACLKELLESNRQTRLEFQQQSEQQEREADAQGPQPPT
ncbi:bublin coiled-coil protein [Indicator indicator]|uniref:bublin coiled-coil protein n=1 Tax=Indicator indicator TaxID=1002788 RepID=UPI0023DF6756|nr:bublin coiled-coil protein [Indicator indicator]